MEKIIKLCLELLQILLTENISVASKNKVYALIDDTVKYIEALSITDVRTYLFLTTFSDAIKKISQSRK